MLYKRDEAFRFQFKKPIQGQFKIVSINGKSQTEAKMGTANILDISPNGLKFSTKLDLPIESNKFLLEVSFVLNERMLEILGVPIWKKGSSPLISYGLRGMDDHETRVEIIEELKEFSKRSLRSIK